jgi:hypothetical protein
MSQQALFSDRAIGSRWQVGKHKTFELVREDRQADPVYCHVLRLVSEPTPEMMIQGYRVGFEVAVEGAWFTERVDVRRVA